MRMQGVRPRRFQVGGVNPPSSLGALQPGAGMLSPQQMQALQARQQLMQQAGAPGAAPMQPNPMAQQLAARGAMPTPSPGAGPVSTMGPTAPGGMMPPRMGGMPPGGAGSMPPGAGGQAMQQGTPGQIPRPGMGGPMAGPPMAQGPQNPMAALAAQQNPQAAAALQGLGMAKGGPVGFGAKECSPEGLPDSGGKIKGGDDPSSTATVSGNLPTRPGRGKMAHGGVSKFDSLKSVGDNLPLQKQSDPDKHARGGVLKKKPRALDKKARDRKDAPSVPVYDKPSAGDDGWPPSPNFTGAPGPNAPAPVPAATPISPTPAGPPGMKGGGKVGRSKDGRFAKGGECDKMAAGGAAKVRRGFPDVIKPGKKAKFASGGSVRGYGAAERGKNFSGIY